MYPNLLLSVCRRIILIQYRFHSFQLHLVSCCIEILSTLVYNSHKIQFSTTRRVLCVCFLCVANSKVDVQCGRETAQQICFNNHIIMITDPWTVPVSSRSAVVASASSAIAVAAEFEDNFQPSTCDNSVAPPSIIADEDNANNVLPDSKEYLASLGTFTLCTNTRPPASANNNNA